MITFQFTEPWVHLQMLYIRPFRRNKGITEVFGITNRSLEHSGLSKKIGLPPWQTL